MKNRLHSFQGVVTASLSLEPGLSFRSLNIYIYFTFGATVFERSRIRDC